MNVHDDHREARLSMMTFMLVSENGEVWPGIFHVGVFVSCPQTSSTKSSHKFYPVKGEFSDENSDEGGFHKLGNPTFSHPELVGALWPLFTDTSRRGMSAIYFTKFAPIEFLFPAPSSEEYLVLRRN